MLPVIARELVLYRHLFREAWSDNFSSNTVRVLTS